MRLIIGYFIVIAASFLALAVAAQQGATAEAGKTGAEPETEAGALPQAADVSRSLSY